LKQITVKPLIAISPLLSKSRDEVDRFCDSVRRELDELWD